MSSNNKNLATPFLWLTLILLLASPAMAATDPVGKLFFALRGVEIQRPSGVLDVGKKGSLLFEGDQVITGEKGRAQIMFVDGTRIAIKPNTVFGIEAYKPPQPAQNQGVVAAARPGSATLSMLKGGIRAVSGGITKGNPDGLSIKTPVATMGIRGTDFSAALIPPARGGDDGQQLVVGVRDGQVRITNAKGSIDVYKGEFAVASKKKKPKISIDPPDGLIGSDENGSEVSDDEGESGSDTGNGSQQDDTQPATTDSSDGSTESTTDQPAADNSADDSATDDETENSKQESDNSQQSADGESDETSGSNAQPDADDSGGSTEHTPPPSTSDPTAQESPPQSESGTNLEDPEAVNEEVTATRAPNATAFAGSRENGSNESQIVIGHGVSEADQTSIGSDGEAITFASDIAGSNNQQSSIFSIEGDNGELTATTFELGSDPDTGYTWGRWADGSASVNPGPDGEAETAILNDQQSLHWLYSVASEGDPLSEITASANYSLVGNTSPTDANGNIGVLGVADLSANFTSQVVDLNVQLLINDQNWNASGQGSISSGGLLPFSGSLTGTATQDNTQVDTLSGSYNGSFSPNIVDIQGSALPAGAGFSYGLEQGTTNQTVTGVAIVGSPTLQQAP